MRKWAEVAVGGLLLAAGAGGCQAAVPIGPEEACQNAGRLCPTQLSETSCLARLADADVGQPVLVCLANADTCDEVLVCGLPEPAPPPDAGPGDPATERAVDAPTADASAAPDPGPF